MAIPVTCPGCHKRFQVSDKFAGKEGPCPSCKGKIRVPSKSEEVVVHAPEEFGPKDSAGRPTLKPIERSETKLSLPAVLGIVAAVLTVLVLAVVLRSPEGNVSSWILGFGAVLLGPPLALAGYSFLRNDDLEPYRGWPLLIRVSACGIIYALLWAGYAAVRAYVFGGDSLEVFHLLFVIPPFVAVGGLTALACLDLDFGSAAIHYGLYLLCTIALSWIMGVALI